MQTLVRDTSPLTADASRPLKVRLPKNELCSEERVREHYAIERKLAERLRQSTREDRKTL